MLLCISSSWEVVGFMGLHCRLHMVPMQRTCSAKPSSMGANQPSQHISGSSAA